MKANFRPFEVAGEKRNGRVLQELITREMVEFTSRIDQKRISTVYIKNRLEEKW